MKSHFISDLRIGDELDNEPFLVRDMVRRTTKDGRPFLLYTLGDKTGQEAAVFWDVPDYIQSWIKTGVVALVTGRVVSYKDALQITTTDLNLSSQHDMADFLPASKREREEMVAELHQFVADLAQPWQGLVRQLLLSEAFLPQFASAPAARGFHHAFIGGLLEHTLSMTRLAVYLADSYPYVNKDLLVAGTLLHDMGKVIEYETAAGFSFTDDGRLVGHIVRAITMIEKAAAEPGMLSAEQLRQLVHLVVSHHGKQEWGSPVVPKTLEAVILHQIDMLDSRVQGFYDHVRANDSVDGWTVKSSLMFGTDLMRPDGMAE